MSLTAMTSLTHQLHVIGKKKIFHEVDVRHV